MSAFPIKSFRQALQDTKSIQSKLSKNFLVECKKHNMIWIDGITEQFSRIFSSKQNIKIKVNSMYAIQYFVQLAEYPLMTLFQVYILPTILQIALFRSHDQTYQNTTQYFSFQGYSTNIPNIRQLSHNYIVLAQDFVFSCASIKPYRTFESNQMNQLSQYKKAAQKIQKCGISPREKNQEQEHRVQLARQQFLKNLSKFDNDSQYYIAYFMKKIQEYIIQGNKMKQTLDFKKIMKYGDVFLTSEAIGHCCQALQNSNFEFKKNALLLIHEFVLWGDIQAIMMINYGDYIEQIYKRITQVKGNISINVGQQIYPQIIGQKQLKKIFYIEFLKCLHTWAVCLPRNNFDKQKIASDQQQQFSPVFLFWNELKQVKQFKFPDNPYLPKHKKQLQENLLKNKERNNLLMRQLQQNVQDALSLSISKRSIKPINKFQKYKSKNSMIKQQRQSQFLTTSEMFKYIKEAQILLQDFLQKIQNNQVQEAQIILLKLNQFCDNFENKLEIIEESLDEDQLQNIFNKGVGRIDQIKNISDHFQDLKQQKINLMKLQQLVKYQLTKPRQNLASQYMSEYKSRKSKKSMSKSFGNTNSQNLFYGNNRSIQLKNFSHDRYKVPIDQERNKIKQNNNQSEYKSSQNNKSEVSKSSNAKTAKQKNNEKKSNKSGSEVQESQEGSYDFQIKDYGFRQVKAQQSQNDQNSSQHSMQKSQRDSIKIQKPNRQSQTRQKNQPKRSNIYTQQFKKKQSNIQFSQKGSRNSSRRSSQKKQKQSSIHKGRQSKDSHSNFTKSRKLNESQSFMIASGNMKKMNQSQYVPSENDSMKGRQTQGKQNKVQENVVVVGNPHLMSSADIKQLNSFNITHMPGFSKAPLSSVNRISSIQQQRFKFQMFNSQDRQIFQDDSSQKQANQEHQKIKQQLKQEQNPGFGMVFKNKSNLKSSRTTPQSNMIRNYDTPSQIRDNLSPRTKINSKENSKISNNNMKEIIQYTNRTSKNQYIPVIEKVPPILTEKKLRSKHQNPIVKTNIYTSDSRTPPPMVQNFQDSLNKSSSINKSLRRSQNNNKSLRKQKQQYYKKQRQQFNQSSFVDSSQDTPRILQRNKDYYREQSPEQSHTQKKSIYLQQNTSPKNQRISFASNSRNNILSSKLAISQRDEKQQYDRSNLTPRASQNHKSRIPPSSYQNKMFSRQPSIQSKQKIKSVLSSQKSKIKSQISNPSEQIKKKIQSSKRIQHLANKQLSQIKVLQQRLQRVQKDSKYLLEFQRSTIRSPQTPRYVVTPRSPRFRNGNDSSSIDPYHHKQRISFLNHSNYISPQNQKRNFDLNSSYSRQYLVNPQGRLIKKQNFTKYFQQLKQVQQRKGRKKHLLRNKQLIHKTQNIQIGITILRQRNRLKIIYFITPQKPIQKLQCKIEENKKLKIKCSPQNQLTMLQIKKQYKIYIICEIMQFPYTMPKISFSYKNDKRTFFLGQGSALIVPQTRFQLLLPVFFIKFIQFCQISSPEISHLLQGRQVLRTEEFLLNSKIIRKPHQVNDYLPNLTLLSENSVLTIYSAKAKFFNHSFIFKFNFKINHFMYVQAVSIQGDDKKYMCQNIIEYFMVCIEELFSKDCNDNVVMKQ